MIRPFRIFLTLIIIGAHCFTISAEDYFAVDNDMGENSILTDWTKLYHSQYHPFTIENILAGDSIKFHKRGNDFGQDFEFPAVVWAKIKLQNPGPLSQLRILGLRNLSDSIFVYEIIDNQITGYSQFGRFRSQIQETIPIVGNHVYIHLHPGQKKTFYIKSIYERSVKSERYSYFSLHDIKKSIGQSQVHFGMQAFYLGILFVIGILGFLQSFIFRSKVFLYFGILAFIFAIYFALLSMTFETFICPITDEVKFWLSNIVIISMVSISFLLVSSYISLKEFLPRYYSFFISLTLFILIGRILNLLFLGMNEFFTFAFNLFLMLWIIFALIPILNLAARGYAASKKLLIALSGLLITFFIFILGLMQIIPTNIWILNSVQLGTLIFFVLLFFGMIDRINIMNEEKYAATALAKFKSRFFANVSHEFRTPLTVILGMASQIRKDPKKHLDQGVRLIESNGKNLLHLINQLLDLSKLENGSVKLNLQSGNIVAYLSYLTESYTAYANSKNLSLRFFSSVESLVMDFDAERIKEVLGNLISNALKFTSPGGEIRVKLSRENEFVLLEVTDNGIGIAKEDLSKVFIRFYQIDTTKTFGVEGTGIGLSYVSDLVELMGGQITVKSQIGKGSTFVVKLPIQNQMKTTAQLGGGIEISADANVSNPEKPPLVVAAAGRPQLLLIEDNPDLVEYLNSYLGELYQMDVALNGQIGIEKAFKKVPDIIISDVMMPEKDGFEVCETLKNDQRTSHIPIILLTAKADHRSRIEGLSRGADVYMAKPFDEKELQVCIEMLLEKQKRLAAWFSKNELESVSDSGLEEALLVEGEFIQKVQTIIEDNYTNEDFALPHLCRTIGMSRSQLFRKMTSLVNKSPSDYIRSFRLKKANELLTTSNLSVSEVAWKVGFKDPSHFSKSFQEEFRKRPSEVNK